MNAAAALGCSHNLRKKISLAVDGRWFPPGIEFIHQAKQQRYYKEGFPWVDVEKPFWWEVPVVMALTPPDSIGLLHNHFNQYGILSNEAWGRPPRRERVSGGPRLRRPFAESLLPFSELGHGHTGLGRFGQRGAAQPGRLQPRLTFVRGKSFPWPRSMTVCATDRVS